MTSVATVRPVPRLLAARPSREDAADTLSDAAAVSGPSTELGPRASFRPIPRTTALPPFASVVPHARLGTGVLLTGLVLAGVGAATHSSLLVAPFAATAALKHAAPHSPAARPRNVIGGYLVGALVGVVVGLLAGSGAVAMAAAAALAAVAMSALGVEHPPAVAMAIVALQAPTPWVLQVAAVGAVTMTLTTMLLVPVLHRRVDVAPATAVGAEVGL